MAFGTYLMLVQCLQGLEFASWTSLTDDRIHICKTRCRDSRSKTSGWGVSFKRGGVRIVAGAALNEDQYNSDRSYLKSLSGAMRQRQQDINAVGEPRI